MLTDVESLVLNVATVTKYFQLNNHKKKSHIAKQVMNIRTVFSNMRDDFRAILFVKYHPVSDRYAVGLTDVELESSEIVPTNSSSSSSIAFYS